GAIGLRRDRAGPHNRGSRGRSSARRPHFGPLARQGFVARRRRSAVSVSHVPWAQKNMVAGRVHPSKKSNRAGKRAGRRSVGIQVVDRAGHWHIRATVRAGGRSRRIRKSLGLAVETTSQDEAESAAQDLVDEIRARATKRSGRGDAVAIAAHRYLSLPRDRPIKHASIRIVQEIVQRFGERRLNEIADEEWCDWIDGDARGKRPGRMSGRSSATRERFLNTVMAFL